MLLPAEGHQDLLGSCGSILGPGFCLVDDAPAFLKLTGDLPQSCHIHKEVSIQLRSPGVQRKVSLALL